MDGNNLRLDFSIVIVSYLNQSTAGKIFFNDENSLRIEESYNLSFK